MDLKEEVIHDENISSSDKQQCRKNSRGQGLHKLPTCMLAFVFLYYYLNSDFEHRSLLIFASSLELETSKVSHANQLFLSPSSDQNGQAITLVNGFNQRKSEDEEQDGFIMQTLPQTTIAQNDTQTELIDFSTASSDLDQDLTTSSTELSVQNDSSSNDQRIPIDVNRQQFVTHDQLSLLNARTKDENINLSPQNEEQPMSNEQQQKSDKRVKTSRAGPSKVSQVTSFLADWLSYATQYRQNYLEADRQSIHSTGKQLQVASSTSSPVLTTTTSNKFVNNKPATCPGICRSIWTASVLCQNEINAPCPGLLQKCCDKDDVSLNGTPVETSAPLPSTDSDANSTPLYDNLSQTQESSSIERPKTLQPSASATKSQPQELPLGGARNGTAERQPTQPTTATTLLLAAQGHPGAAVYFLSSGNGSGEGDDRDQNVEHERPGTSNRRQELASVAQPTHEEHGARSKHPASQSFDSPLTDSDATGGLKTSAQVVVLQTVNGTILHQHVVDRVKRPSYTNWTDYHLLLMQNKQNSPQNVVYHSNTDPVKKFISATNSTKLNDYTNSMANNSDLTSSQASSVPIACTGLCMPKIHQHFCQFSQTSIKSQYEFKCDNEMDFCCVQPNEYPKKQQSNNTKLATESAANLPDKESEIQLKVMNDQHSGLKSRQPERPKQHDTTSTTLKPTSSESPTSRLPETVTSGQSSDTELGGVGNVLVSLLDSWISGSTQTGNNQSLESQPSESSTTLTAPQNDRRLGLDMSFRQPSEINSTGTGVIASDSSSEQSIFMGSPDQAKCAGYCTLPLFTMLCDTTYRSTDCGTTQKCCVIGQSSAASQNEDIADAQSDHFAPNKQMAHACKGSCLPVYHSSLCTKPNEIQLDSPGCLPNQVCCIQPENGSSNNIEENDNVLAASNLSPDVQQPDTPMKDNSLFAALMPPPPPSVNLNSDLETNEHYLATNGRQRQSSLFVPNNQDLPPQPQPSTRPANAKSTPSSGLGIMNQIYQMFRSGSPVKQRPKATLQQPPLQPQNQLSLMYDPYQQLQMVASNQGLRAGNSVAPQPLHQATPMLYPVQHHNVMLNQVQFPSNQYQLDASTALIEQQNRNRYAQQQHPIEQQQFAPSGYSVAGSPPIPKHYLQSVVQNQAKIAYPYQASQQNHPDRTSAILSLNSPTVALNQQHIPTGQHPLVVQHTNLALPATDRQRYQYGTDNAQHLSFNQPGKNANFVPQSQSQNGHQAQTLVFGASDISPVRNQQNIVAVSNNPRQTATIGHQPVRPEQHIDQQQRFNGFDSFTKTSGSGPEMNLDQRFVTIKLSRPTTVAEPQKQLISTKLTDATSVQSVVSQVVRGNGNKLAPLEATSPSPLLLSQKSPTATIGDTNSRRNNANRQTSKVGNTRVSASESSSQLSSSSSNLNVMISNGPFIDLQRVVDKDSGGHQQSAHSINQRPGWSHSVNNVTSLPGNSGQAIRQSPQRQLALVPLLQPHDLSETGERSPPCPSNCLDPLSCLKPYYGVDDNFSCQTNGFVCCMNRFNTSRPVEVPNAVVRISQVDSNKLDSMIVPEHDDQLVDEAAKSAESITDLGLPSPDVSVPVSAGKNRYHATSCGLPNSRRRASARIMGGHESKPGYWCWQAALMNDKNEYLCGGALIGTKWVLTAAHCITNHLKSESPLYVRLGQHNLNSTQQAKSMLVKTSYVHHNHINVTLDNDIALLRLEDPVELDDSVCIICLPERSSQMEPGKRCTVTGYGFESELGPVALRVRQTDLPIVTDQDCLNKTSAVLHRPFNLPANSFCAGGELGQDACHGDGGSPLSCLVDGYYELAGIVSWGYKCGNKDLPGLYSKVSAFVGWINQIVSVNN